MQNKVHTELIVVENPDFKYHLCELSNKYLQISTYEMGPVLDYVTPVMHPFLNLASFTASKS